MKEISYGNVDALELLVDRYIDLVSRTSFRILCDREDSEYVTVQVFLTLWNYVLDYDDRFTMEEWLLRRTCILSRIRIARRRIIRIFGVNADVFVNASPKVEDQDDYVTKQAWELFCRASFHMTPLQSAVYSLCALEELSKEVVAKIKGVTVFRVSKALERAEIKIHYELEKYGKDNDYDRYRAFLRKVAESLTDHEKLKKEIKEQL